MTGEMGGQMKNMVSCKKYGWSKAADPVLTGLSVKPDTGKEKT